MDHDSSCDRDSILKIRNPLNGYTALHKAVMVLCNFIIKQGLLAPIKEKLP